MSSLKFWFWVYWVFAFLGWKPKGVYVIVEDRVKTSNNPLVALVRWVYKRRTIANVRAISKVALHYPLIMQQLQDFMRSDISVDLTEFDQNGVSRVGDDPIEPTLLDCPFCFRPYAYSTSNGYYCEVCGADRMRS